MWLNEADCRSKKLTRVAAYNLYYFLIRTRLITMLEETITVLVPLLGKIPHFANPQLYTFICTIQFLNIIFRIIQHLLH